ncbi:glycoside hydrolase family 130 protein [Pontiellaceae bacterium B12219]|nr:glycoside hydrolase family 130 protein [Pontiellaceae bacterium B12219]
MKTIFACRNNIALRPDNSRVILRPFIPSSHRQISSIIRRVLDLTEDDVARQLDAVTKEFSHRHHQMKSMLYANYERVREHIPPGKAPSLNRELLIGALFFGEYSLESAALFNPSIVPHPDQSGVPKGQLRFIMSLRATGEGHISSIEFRTGLISSDGGVSLDPVSSYVSVPKVLPDPSYDNRSFVTKLREMDFDDKYTSAVMGALGDRFTRRDLALQMERVLREAEPATHHLHRTLDHIRWLADSNYELLFDETVALSERVIFPVSANESNGIEDARFVRFVDDDDTVMYYATYTAYNGRDILPQLIETQDFLHFHIRTLNGRAVQNKGMALFPRRINGLYAMLSRQDDQNLFIMLSESAHHWSDPQIILRPKEMWEYSKIGNCGSPIETEAGWLVITHGVGPMRKYCIGAVLLDLEDPAKVIGRLKEPLLVPEVSEREGYVPNVVYSCGALLHKEWLILPFAVSDHVTTVSSIRLNDLLGALLT